MTNNIQKTYQIYAFLAVIFSLCIMGMATQWTFNLFEPQFLWKAYNYYFLGIIEGRLDIPVESIGREGAFFNSKAYMYYGLLPILPRALLFPFVDLTTTPASYFSVLFFTLLGNIVLQLYLVKTFIKKSENTAINQLMLFGLSVLVWFSSASFLISQNATIYHEPYAAALCLAKIYLALLLRDGFFLRAAPNVNLLPYAIIAGLCVHARMPMALALYLLTGLLILIQSYRILSANSQPVKFLKLVSQSIQRFWLSIVALGLFGFSILWLNYTKFEDPFKFMGGNYGYFFLEGFTDRRCNLVPKGDFAGFLRIFANIYIYLTGDQEYHWSLTQHLQTGFGRKELPLSPIALLWLFPIGCFIYVLFTLVKHIKAVQNKLLLIALFMVSAGAIFQLSYPTITHRYISALWLPLFLSVLFVWYQNINVNTQLTKKTISVMSMVVVSFSVGLIYQLRLATTDKYYLEDGPIFKHQDFHYTDEDNAFLGTLTPQKIQLLNKEFRAKKKLECQKLQEVDN